MINCPDFFLGGESEGRLFLWCIFFVKTNVFLVCSSGVERKVRDFFCVCVGGVGGWEIYLLTGEQNFCLVFWCSIRERW